MEAMDLSVQKPATISPIRHGRKAAIMRKFLIDETERRKISAVDSKSESLPDLSFSCFSDSSASDDVILVEDRRDVDVISIKESEAMSSEEEVYHKSPVKTSAEVASFDKSYDTMNKIKYRDYKCSTCQYTTTEKRLLKTHMLLHELGKHEITSDTLVHTCEHKQMPCYLCNLPKITVKIDIKPNPLLSANNSLECQVCYRKILKKSGMNKHLQAHVDQLKKQSALLGKKEKNFNQKNQRILQLVAIGKKFPFECSKCELPFAEEYDKRAHEELCRRRQYKHLWNFSDVKINKRKILNTKDVNAENTMELKTREGLEMEVKIIDAKEEKLIDINMECQDSPAEAPWRPWA